MPYRRILKHVVDHTPLAVGAIMVDWEGEAVQEFCHCEQYEIRFIAAHQGIILGRLRELHSRASCGDIEDMVVTTSVRHLIAGYIDPDYALVMSVERSCPMNLALRNFREAVKQLKKEL